MKYKIVEIKKSGLFEIQEQVEKRKLTFKGFKNFLVWERMHIDFFWNGKWVLNLWNSIEEAESWLIEFENWKKRTNKEQILSL